MTFQKWSECTAIILNLLLVFGSFRASAQPTNSTFLTRTTLTGTAFDLDVDNSQSISDPLDPSSLFHTLWWSWQAPADGRFSLWIVPLAQSGPLATAQLHVGIYRGPDLEHLELVDSSPNGSWGVNHVLLDVAQGDILHWVIGTPRFVNVPGPFHMRINAGPIPTHDDFPGGSVIEGEFFRAVATNAVASSETDELFNPERSLWWSWKAPRNGMCIVQAVDPSSIAVSYPLSTVVLTKVMDVFSGSQLGQLIPLPARMRWGSADGSVVQSVFEVTAGQTYRIRVAGWFGLEGKMELTVAMRMPPSVFVQSDVPKSNPSEREPAAFNVWGVSSQGRIDHLTLTVTGSGGGTERKDGNSWSFRIPVNRGSHEFYATAKDELGLLGQSTPQSFNVRPRNDDFEDRELLEGPVVDVPVDTAGATTNVGAGSTLGENLWWKWISPTNGVVTVQLHQAYGSLGVYAVRRDQPPAVVLEKSLTFSSPRFLQHIWQESFLAEQGTEYAFSVAGANGLRIVAASPPGLELKSLDSSDRVFVGDTLRLNYQILSPDDAGSEVWIQDSGVFTLTNRAGSLTWNQPVQWPGHHVLQATARDANGLFASSATIEFNAEYKPPPNDDYLHRIPIQENQLVLVETSGTSSEPWEMHPWYPSAWWEWTAPRDGSFQFWMTQNYCVFGFEVYEGEPESDFRFLGASRQGDSSFEGARLEVNAKAGVRYSIAVSQGFCPAPAQFRIIPGRIPSLRFVSPLPNSRVSVGRKLTVQVDLDAEPGQVSLVELRQGTHLLHQWTEPPFTTEITPDEVTPYYGLRCAAFDRLGKVCAAQEITLKTTQPPPANDLLEQRTLLSGAPVRFQARLGDATGQEYEPDGRNVLWWEWIPPRTGAYSFTLSNWWYTFRMSIAERSLNQEWKVIADTTSSQLKGFQAVADKRYLIGLSGDTLVDCTIIPEEPAPIVNIRSKGPDIVAFGDPFDVVVEVGGPLDVEWVDFFQDDRLVARLRKVPYEATLIANQSGGSSVRAFIKDRSVYSTYSSPVFQAVGPDVAVNDHFAQATVLVGPRISALFEMREATLEPGEPGVEEPMNSSIWLTWVAPTSGQVRYGIQNSFDLVDIDVYQGDSLQALKLVDRSHSSSGNYAADGGFAAKAGTRYHLRLTSHINAHARGLLNLYLNEMAPLRVTGIEENGLDLELADDLNRLWQLWVSDDLKEWRSEGWFRATGDRWRWSDRSGLRPQRFYRVEPEFRISPHSN